MEEDKYTTTYLNALFASLIKVQRYYSLHCLMRAIEFNKINEFQENVAYIGKQVPSMLSENNSIKLFVALAARKFNFVYSGGHLHCQKVSLSLTLRASFLIGLTYPSLHV